MRCIFESYTFCERISTRDIHREISHCPHVVVNVGTLKRQVTKHAPSLLLTSRAVGCCPATPTSNHLGLRPTGGATTGHCAFKEILPRCPAAPLPRCPAAPPCPSHRRALKVARWQNLIPSFPCTPSSLAQSKERKGKIFAVQLSGVIDQKPEGPNTYDLKIWLSPSGNHARPHGLSVSLAYVAVLVMHSLDYGPRDAADGSTVKENMDTEDVGGFINM